MSTCNLKCKENTLKLSYCDAFFWSYKIQIDGKFIVYTVEENMNSDVITLYRKLFENGQFDRGLNPITGAR